MKKFSAYEQGFVDGYKAFMKRSNIIKNLPNISKVVKPKAAMLKPPKIQGSVRTKSFSTSKI